MTPSQLVESLERNKKSESRNELVFEIERQQFLDSDQRIKLKALLLEIAIELKNKGNRDAYVVWSAIRTYCSMVETREEIRQLTQFLDGDTPLSTRLTVLSSIMNIFEIVGPTQLTGIGALVDAIEKHADAFVNPLIFSAGENAATAILSVSCLIAIGDPRSLHYVRALVDLNKPWAIPQLERDIESIRERQTNSKRRSLWQIESAERLWNEQQIRFDEALKIIQPPPISISEENANADEYADLHNK